MKDHTTAAYHTPPFEVLLDYCRDNQITHRSNIEMKLVAVSVNGAAALYELGLQVTPNDQVLQVTLEIPVAAAHEEMHPLVAEVVARANYRLLIGHFDLDMDDGRLRYRVGHVIGSAALSNEMIMTLIGMALEMADRYFPALMTVMFAGHTPSDAVYLSELTSDLNEHGEDVPCSRGESADHRNSPIEKFGAVQGAVLSTLLNEGVENPDKTSRKGRSGWAVELRRLIFGPFHGGDKMVENARNCCALNGVQALIAYSACWSAPTLADRSPWHVPRHIPISQRVKRSAQVLVL